MTWIKLYKKRERPTKAFSPMIIPQGEKKRKSSYNDLGMSAHGKK